MITSVTVSETTITLPTYLPAALVGLAGLWISGGIEFNWPQHHRPATFLPVNYEIEKHPDGSVTVWCSGHCKRRLKSAAGVMCVAGEMDLGMKVLIDCWHRSLLEKSMFSSFSSMVIILFVA